VMRGWSENSIDCVVTDPPYGIGFMGRDWDKTLPPKEAFREVLRVLKPGALAFVMSSPRQDVLWRMLKMLEDVGFVLKQSFISWIYKTGFPKAMNISKMIDKKLGFDALKIKELESSRRKRDNVLGRMFGKKTYEYEYITNEAKKWNGWKSIGGLKPALECILMVYKPLSEGTIVDNVLKWGTGAINVDACRIPFYKPIKPMKPSTNPPHPNDHNGSWADGAVKEREMWFPSRGRFPANLLVSDKALDTGKITKSVGGRTTKRTIGGREIYRGGKILQRDYLGDAGDQSRYFDLDAWAKHHGFLDVPKPSQRERNLGLGNMKKGSPPRTGRSKPAKGRKRALGRDRANFHPTVKPIKLMAYLIELGCSKNGVVLDPFVGSGTTCIAAKRLRRKWIGIEDNPVYVEIARRRITPKGPLDQYITPREDEERR